MTVVNPKSISGINSITMASGSDNLLTIHTTNTTERVRVNSDGDVIVGSGITVSPDGDIFTTGVTTSTTFVGALTGNVTGNVTGNISGGTVAGSTGTFTGDISVTDSTGEISVTSNGGSSNAAKINVTGASGGNAEIHLSADAAANAADNVVIKQQNGGPLKVNTNNDSVEALTITSDGNIGINQGSPNYKLHVSGTTSAARISCNDSASGISALAVTNEANSDLESVIFTNRSSLGSSVNIPISFHTNGKTNEKIRMHPTGELSVPSGITLGLTAADKTASNTLDDYEEGDHTPTFNNISGATISTNFFKYIKIGQLVHFQFYINFTNTNNDSDVIQFTMPFTNNQSNSWCVFTAMSNNGSLSPILGRIRENSSTAEIKYIMGDGILTYTNINGYWVIGAGTFRTTD